MIFIHDEIISINQFLDGYLYSIRLHTNVPLGYDSLLSDLDAHLVIFRCLQMSFLQVSIITRI